MIERLEGRQFLSASPATLHAVSDSNHPGLHADVHHARKAAKITISTDILGDYGGSYFIGLSQGNVSLSVTNIRGKVFSGTLEFSDYNDGVIASSTFKATMGKYGKFKLTFKSGGTSFTGNGSYNPQASYPEMTVSITKGKFDGRKIQRFIPGEFVVLQGL